jgi:tetratricopeptide (TPR) repeat protein
MEPELKLTNSYVFSVYAGNDVDRWMKLHDWPIQHHVLGSCRLVKVSAHNNDLRLHFVMEEHEPSGQSKKFLPKQFPNFFTITTLPEGLTDFNNFKTDLQEQVHREQEIKQEEHRRKVQEDKAKKHFFSLRAKYNIFTSKEIEPTSFLYRILLKLENQELVTLEDFEWLENQGFYKFLAEYHERRYADTGDGWDIVKAGKYFRKAGQPKRVLALYETDFSSDPRLESAMFTNLGGAYRDIKDLDKAEESAKNATEIQPKSFYPYNLLGAIYYQRGNPEAGDNFFERAIKLGSSTKVQDNFIRQAVNDSESVTKHLVAKYLLKKNPKRYQWAKAYLKK